jgi:hypothetical protein
MKPGLNPKLVYLYTAAMVAAVRNRLQSQKARTPEQWSGLRCAL